MVAEMDDQVVGFMIYELHKNRLAHPQFRRGRSLSPLGIGTQMVAKLVGKLSDQRRNRILLEIRETNLPAQLFFRQSGFRAVSVLHEFYEDTPEDAYLMQYPPRRPTSRTSFRSTASRGWRGKRGDLDARNRKRA